jgi:quercetin dioxygenase-like cupin family protein
METTKRLLILFTLLGMVTGLSSILFSCSNKEPTESAPGENTTVQKERQNTQYVFETTNLYRYTFPTHINDIIVDRAQATNSEVFMVYVEPGKSVHHHKHDDTEQIFYMLEGTGILSIGESKKEYPVKPGDVIRIPVTVLHSIRTDDTVTIKYLCVDCFGGKARLEPTWDEHVRVVCKENRWNYDEVVSSNQPTIEN